MNVPLMERGGFPVENRLRSDLELARRELAQEKALGAFYKKAYDRTLIECAQLHSTYGLLGYQFRESASEREELRARVEELEQLLEQSQPAQDNTSSPLHASQARVKKLEAALRLIVDLLERGCHTKSEVHEAWKVARDALNEEDQEDNWDE